MPKPGFKSITIAESVYTQFYDTYSKNKASMMLKGVSSFSGYVTYMLEELMQKDKTFARYAPKLEKLAVESDVVLLRDNIKGGIVEVAVHKGQLYCRECKEQRCVHVGFVFSLPDVYEALHARGIKNPR